MFPGYPCCCVETPETNIYATGSALLNAGADVVGAISVWEWTGTQLQLIGTVRGSRQWESQDNTADTFVIPVTQVNVFLQPPNACGFSNASLVLTMSDDVPDVAAVADAGGPGVLPGHGFVDQTNGTKGTTAFIRVSGVISPGTVTTQCDKINAAVQNDLRMRADFSVARSFSPSPGALTWNWAWGGPILSESQASPANIGHPTSGPDSAAPLELTAIVTGVREGPAFDGSAAYMAFVTSLVSAINGQSVTVRRSHFARVGTPAVDCWWGYTGGVELGLNDGESRPVVLIVNVTHDKGGDPFGTIGIRAGIKSTYTVNGIRYTDFTNPPGAEASVETDLGLWEFLNTTNGQPVAVLPDPAAAYNQNTFALGVGDDLDWSQATVTFS